METEKEKYRFKPRKCSCGLDLRDKVSNITSLYRNVKPMGICPSCGAELLLDASPEGSKVILNYPVLTEEVQPAVETQAVQPKSSRQKK